MAIPTERKAANAVIKAISTLDFNVAIFAYIMTHAPDAVVGRFFNICIAFLNELASQIDNDIATDTIQYNRAIAAKRIIDRIDGTN
jgi:hypothetical protein